MAGLPDWVLEDQDHMMPLAKPKAWHQVKPARPCVHVRGHVCACCVRWPRGVLWTFAVGSTPRWDTHPQQQRSARSAASASYGPEGFEMLPPCVHEAALSWLVQFLHGGALHLPTNVCVDAATACVELFACSMSGQSACSEGRSASAAEASSIT